MPAVCNKMALVKHYIPGSMLMCNAGCFTWYNHILHAVSQPSLKPWLTPTLNPGSRGLLKLPSYASCQIHHPGTPLANFNPHLLHCYIYVHSTTSPFASYKHPNHAQQGITCLSKVYPASCALAIFTIACIFSGFISLPLLT
jgi:hypothetical protein